MLEWLQVALLKQGGLKQMISGPIQPQSFCDFVILIFRYAWLIRRSGTSSRHLLLLLLAPGVPSQQSQWALWVPSAGFVLCLGAQHLAPYVPVVSKTWWNLLVNLKADLQPCTLRSRDGKRTPHTKCQAQANLFSSHDSTCWKTLQWPEKAGNSYRDIFLTLKPWSLSYISGQRWCWGLQMLSCRCAVPFCFGLAHTSLTFAGDSWVSEGKGLAHAALPSPWMEAGCHPSSSDRDWMSELHAQPFTEINSHTAH